MEVAVKVEVVLVSAEITATRFSSRPKWHRVRFRKSGNRSGSGKRSGSESGNGSGTRFSRKFGHTFFFWVKVASSSFLEKWK